MGLSKLLKKKRLLIAGFYISLILLIVGGYWAWHSIDISPPDLSKFELYSVNTSDEDNGYKDLSFDRKEFWFREEKSYFRLSVSDFYLLPNFEAPKSLKIFAPSEEGKDSVSITEAKKIVHKNQHLLNRLDIALSKERIQGPLYEKNENYSSLGHNMINFLDVLYIKFWVHISEKEQDEAIDTAWRLINFGERVINGVNDGGEFMVSQSLIHRGIELLRYAYLLPNSPNISIQTSIRRLQKLVNFELINENLTKTFVLGLITQTKHIVNLRENPSEAKLILDPLYLESSFLPNETLSLLTTHLAAYLDAVKIQPHPPYRINSTPPSFPEYERNKLKKTNRFLRGRNAAGKLLVNRSLLNSFDITNSHLLKLDASVKLTRLKLALLLFYRENGQLPEKLDELIPKYLSKLPANLPSGEPFTYNKAKRIVYSLGKNGEELREIKIKHSKSSYPKGIQETFPLAEQAFSDEENNVMFLEFPGMKPLAESHFIVVEEPEDEFDDL